ncbi:MAG: flagellar filament capping protein FliD, partial [Gammaproteobacteria bacterium]|nr:flagellar filament capping protein FliD [Gammaproteobacteria bacterium]
MFTKIADATGGAVTAAYSKDGDKITLSSSAAIVLGSATDSSNFLQVARLSSNNATSLTSDSPLGAVRLGNTLAEANFATSITGGGAGGFKINGVSIQYDTSTDSVAAVLDRINNSAAGVRASYDAANNRFALENKGTGSLGIALEDVAGSNFLAATGLAGGSLELGRNLQYTVNNGGPLTSQSNIIGEASSGLTGLNVTALAENSSFTVTVGMDTARIKSAITGFVEAYNSSQSQIGSYTASSTDAQGKVTAGLLADDAEATSLNARLRSLATGTLAGMSGMIGRLDSLGIRSNGYDDLLSLGGIADLDTALADNPAGVKEFFSKAGFGLAVQFDKFLESSIG